MFKAFYLSFFSKPFYRDIVENWKGPAFGLLFAIVMLHSVCFTLYLNRGYGWFLANEAPHIVAQIPAVSIIDGKVHIDKNWPYVITDKKGQTLVRFDTNFDESKFAAGQMWVTGDTVHIRRQYDEIRSFYVKNYNNVSFDKIAVQELLNKSYKWFMAAMFPIILISFFLWRMLQVGIYSLIGLGLNRVMGVYLTYPQIVRLCVAALIPVLLIDCVLLFIYPMEWPWIGFFLAMGYLVFGLRANRELIR